MTDRLVSVAVPVPALGLLTYRVPSDQAMPVPGARVIVPLGPRQLTGVVVGHVSAVDVAFKVKCKMLREGGGIFHSLDFHDPGKTLPVLLNLQPTEWS